MLATAAALQLLVLSQVAAPREVRPDEAGPEDAAPARPSEVTQAEETPPLPRKPARGEAAPEPSLEERPAAVVPPKPSRPRQLSLLSAETLDGGTASLAWAGWSSLGIMYGQGITKRDDLGGMGEFDWSKTEMHLGVFYRRTLGEGGGIEMAGRLAAAWYMDFGAGWVYGENHSDRGVEFVPGLSFSTRAASGVLSAVADGAITVTLKGSAGLLFVPRVSLAYETTLYPDVTVGARAGLAYRAGAGDAPLPDGQAELMFLVLAGYQML